MTPVVQTSSSSRRRREQRRLELLALAAMAIIIVVPWSLVDKDWQRTLAACANVESAHEVSTLLCSLQADVCDFEAVALTLSKGVSNAALQESMKLPARFESTLSHVSQLMSDRPEQLLRLGQIKARLERRTAIAQSLPNQPEYLQRPLIDELVSSDPIRDLVIDLHADEDAHRKGKGRQKYFRELGEQQRVLRLVSLFLQLSLLAVVMWLMWRQLNQHLEAESRSADAGEQARQVFQAVREPTALIDGKLNVVSSNPARAALSSSREGGEFSDLCSDPLVGHRLHHVVNHGRELWDYDHRFRDASGVDRELLINAPQIRMESGASTLVLVTLTDMTVQRASQHRVEELNRQLEGKIEQISKVNRELEAFSHSVSHDLRAPLRHIAGFSEKLHARIGEQDDEKSRHYLDVIARSAKRMSQLIDDLLVYSRLGRGALRMKPVDMQTLVEERLLSRHGGDFWAKAHFTLPPYGESSQESVRP